MDELAYKAVKKSLFLDGFSPREIYLGLVKIYEEVAHSFLTVKIWLSLHVVVLLLKIIMRLKVVILPTM